jgi:hypothetical protein
MADSARPHSAILNARDSSARQTLLSAVYSPHAGDRLAEYKDFGSSNDWHQRLLVILEGARLWVRREEEAHEPSPGE